MFIITRIIFKEWIQALLGSILILFLVITIGDIVNGFLRNYEARRVFLEYALKMPNLMGKVFPISGLLATLFSINQLKTKNELVAILATGFSVKKFYSLFIFFSFIVSLIQFLNLGFLDPFVNKIKRQEFEKSRRQESKYLARSLVGDSAYLWYKTNSYFASFLAYDPKNQALKDVSFYFYDSNHKGYKYIFSHTANYINDFKWEFKDPVIYENLTNENFPSVEKSASLILKLSEEPASFSQFESDITTLDVFELIRFVKKLEATEINVSEYKIMIFEKFSLSLICIIFALIPATGIFDPNRRSDKFGRSVVYTLVFSVAFWMLYSFVITLGTSGKISPLFSTMSIPTLFIVFLLHSYYKHIKL